MVLEVLGYDDKMEISNTTWSLDIMEKQKLDSFLSLSRAFGISKGLQVTFATAGETEVEFF